MSAKKKAITSKFLLKTDEYITNKISRKTDVAETREEARSLLRAGTGVHFHYGNREQE